MKIIKFSSVLIMSILLTFALSLTVIGESKSKSLSPDEINSLKDRGLTEYLIERYIESGDTYEDLKEMEVVSVDKKHYKVTRTNDSSGQNTLLSLDENNPSIHVEEISEQQLEKELNEEATDSTEGFSTLNDSSTTSTSYKTMTVSITRINNDRYRVSNRVEWHEEPILTLTDAIGVGINANTSPIPGTEFGVQNVYKINGDMAHQFLYLSNNSNWNRSGDYGLNVNLKGDPALMYTYDIFMHYEVTPNVSTVTKIDAYGHYAHREMAWNATPSYSIAGPSMGLSFKINYSVHQPQPHAQVTRY